MSLKRVSILLHKELIQGPKSVMFIMAIVAPFLISLVLSLVFGTLFAPKPKLGITAEDSSQMPAMAADLGSVVVKEYASTPALMEAARDGAVDMGIVIPQGFDDSVAQGVGTEITAYIWGESLAKNRTILGVTIANLIRDMAGQTVPVEIASITLGDAENIPWNDRILPIIVLYAVIIGGIMLPATSVVEEKQKRTLKALAVTPSTLEDVFLAKGLMGIIISVIMGVLILVLNQAFGLQPLLLVMVLALGAILYAEFGILLGILAKDVSTVFTITKAMGIFLVAPALIYMFPQIPQWIGKIFPTYYVVQPIVEISQRGGTWSDIAPEVFVLVGLIVVLLGLDAVATRRLKQREV